MTSTKKPSWMSELLADAIEDKRFELYPSLIKAESEVEVARIALVARLRPDDEANQALLTEVVQANEVLKEKIADLIHDLDLETKRLDWLMAGVEDYTRETIDEAMLSETSSKDVYGRYPGQDPPNKRWGVPRKAG